MRGLAKTNATEIPMNRLLWVGAALMVVSGAALGGDSRGIQFVSWSESLAPTYVNCLGENLTGDSYIKSRFHAFETAAGTFHIVDNWAITVYRVGSITGRAWRGQAVSPFQDNVKLGKGEVVQWVVRSRMTPLDENSPVLLYQEAFKLTINAKGDLVVLREPVDDSEAYTCLDIGN